MLGGFALMALAASVYLVLVLEILKLKRFRQFQLRRANMLIGEPPPAEAEVDAGVAHELETGEFEIVRLRTRPGTLRDKNSFETRSEAIRAESRGRDLGAVHRARHARTGAAADIGADDEVVVTGTVTVPKGTHVDRIWIVDGKINMAGHSEGSIAAVNAPIRISGTVDGDVISLAQPDHPHAERADQRRHRLRRRAPGDPRGRGRLRRCQEARWDRLDGPVRNVSRDPRRDLDRGDALHARARAAAPVARTRRGGRRLQGRRLRGWSRDRLGAALFLGLPLAAVLAIVTLVGIPLGVTVLLALLPLWALGYVTSGWLLGRALVSGEGRSRTLVFLTGWGILRALALVPFLGGLAGLGAVVFGLGALTVALWRTRGRGRGRRRRDCLRL